MTNLNRDAKQTEFGTKGRNLTLAQKTAIEALNLPGFDFIKTVTRNYPMKVFASHLIGFAQYDADKNSLVGKMGVEAILMNFYPVKTVMKSTESIKTGTVCLMAI
jgi:penicillin-binding protein 2B